MLSRSTVKKIKDILERLASGDPVDFEERSFLYKIANENEDISCWLKRAKRDQKHTVSNNNNIDNLIYSLDLGSPDPQSEYNSKREDIAEWFLGAPKWLERS